MLLASAVLSPSPPRVPHDRLLYRGYFDALDVDSAIVGKKKKTNMDSWEERLASPDSYENSAAVLLSHGCCLNTLIEAMLQPPLQDTHYDRKYPFIRCTVDHA